MAPTGADSWQQGVNTCHPGHRELMGVLGLQGSTLLQGQAKQVRAAPRPHSRLCHGPLVPLSIFINSADYHSNGCYPNNSNIVIPIIVI